YFRPSPCLGEGEVREREKGVVGHHIPVRAQHLPIKLSKETVTGSVYRDKGQGTRVKGQGYHVSRFTFHVSRFMYRQSSLAFTIWPRDGARINPTWYFSIAG